MLISENDDDFGYFQRGGWSHNFLPPRGHKLSEILEICTIVRNIRDMLKEMVQISLKYFLNFFFWEYKSQIGGWFVDVANRAINFQKWGESDFLQILLKVTT